ncbi:MAG: hypothetical protein D6B26_03360 [Spirochaetaceae bacterium]|nr:MAG: hypothetical protein D6B26_03360 [Spirochaetaceae bacterium]
MLPLPGLNKIIISFVLLVVLPLPVLTAQVAQSTDIIPNTAESRVQSWAKVRQPLSLVREQKEEIIFQRSTVSNVKYLVIDEGFAVYQLFIPEHEGEYPVAGAGTWVIKRDGENGTFEQAKVFLLSDQEFFVRLFPSGENYVLMDVVLAGDLIHQGVRIPMSLEMLLQQPFSSIIAFSRYLVDWGVFLIDFDHGAWEKLSQIAEEYGKGEGLPEIFRKPQPPVRIMTDRLRSTIFLLACQEPGTIVSGTVVESLRDDAEGVTREVMVFPFFDAEKRFRMLTFVGGRYVSPHTLVAQFPEAYFLLSARKPDAFSF